MPRAYPAQRPVPQRLRAAHAAIIECDACPRLRTYCRDIATIKRAAFRDDTYWARPVPGFGDANARLLVLGLAPAAHGANRTGRVFTGDGVNASGDFLMRAMMAGGFANRATSQHPDDGLTLIDAYVAAAVRCAPPDNKPTPEEVDTCLAHLEAELAALPRIRLVVVLGRIAYDAFRRLLARRGVRLPAAPFAHGHCVDCTGLGVPSVLQSYHPSRQNTHTGRLTDPMLADVFLDARRRLDAGHT
ncbi:uracil-DNA glycosylase, family 4 [Luteitalea pratensis]|uniref:Type-5 uracil-DNA glycosylase n=1 Tax=Luteitalea pratensis TaxID=1855912 RepID=A0A143PTE7_LUTPR|nr:uracil-DNA glycosylase [Luteitalea pratensis]AMY11433.1 uracil-DNA glycosylase, family 4 [Luteitalea pratensis]